MDLQLNGKTALVTGGSEGIGKGIAIALAKEGVDVAICARRKDVLEATASEIARATDEQARQVFANVGEQLFALSKCPDYVVNRGHYFGSNLGDADKKALIAFLKTF